MPPPEVAITALAGYFCPLITHILWPHINASNASSAHTFAALLHNYYLLILAHEGNKAEMNPRSSIFPH